MTASSPEDKDLCHPSIIPHHAYAILEVWEVEGNQLLKIRNPWGDKEWDGDWSDNDSKWTKSIIEAVNPTFANDGTFFMSMKDFVHQFT